MVSHLFFRGNNLLLTEFETTPLMSTYLVALVVSDFVCINGTANSGLDNNLLVRSCGKPTTANQLDFGLDIGIRIIEHFQNLYKVKYPLPKCGKNFCNSCLYNSYAILFIII